MAITLLADGMASGASGASAGCLGGSSGLEARVAGAAGCSSVATGSLVSRSGALAVLMPVVSGLPKLKTLPAIWIEPTTTATMLAAMNSDLTRFISLPRSERPARVGRDSTSGRGARSDGACPAACAARRAAAMKPDLPPGRGGAGAGVQAGDARARIGAQGRRSGPGLERLIGRQVGIDRQPARRRQALGGGWRRPVGGAACAGGAGYAGAGARAGACAGGASLTTRAATRPTGC